MACPDRLFQAFGALRDPAAGAPAAALARGPAGCGLRPARRRIRPATAALAAAVCLAWSAMWAPMAWASTPAVPAAKTAPADSGMDGALFYQLLVAEIQLHEGQAAVAFEVVLEAARRLGRDQLFQRAADIALRARAGGRALQAAQAWREANPESVEAARLELQILVALNRIDEAGGPLQALLGLTPPEARVGLVLALPRFFERAVDARRVAATLEAALRPHAAAPATRLASLTTLARSWQRAGDHDRALQRLQQAHESDPASAIPAFAAIDLMPQAPGAEAVVRALLGAATPDPALRLAYARALLQAQRIADARTQAEAATVERPRLAQAWLMLGAIEVELKNPGRAREVLQRYIELQRAEAEAPRKEADAARAGGADGGAPEAAAVSPHGGADLGLAGTSQAWLLMAQAAEMQGDLAAAEAYLARIDDPQRLLEVQARRATILARQGRLDEALALVRQVPAQDDEAARARLGAEVRLLREVNRWQEAYDTLDEAIRRWPQDTDLMYEQAMAAERLERLQDMERLLRRVIELEPNHGHAHNALGYALADRNLRLQEARALIVRALELSPGDPFITDSLGWVEFRLGRLDEAERLLREAYGKRPDAEIGAHLGEVLWAAGRRDEARRIWREVLAREPGNEALTRTLQRLQPGL